MCCYITHFVNVKYFNFTTFMYYIFSIQLTISTQCLSYLLLLTQKFPPPQIMVNERVVHILLECILVYCHTFSWCIEKMDSYLPLLWNKHGQKIHDKNVQGLSPFKNLLKLLILRTSVFFHSGTILWVTDIPFCKKLIIVG